jgi:hypothetical protein
MALQQFVANMSVDSSQINSATTHTTVPMEPIEELIIPTEDPETHSVSPVEPTLSVATIVPSPEIMEPVGPVAVPVSRGKITNTVAMATGSASSVDTMDFFDLTAISKTPLQAPSQTYHCHPAYRLRMYHLCRRRMPLWPYWNYPQQPSQQHLM